MFGYISVLLTRSNRTSNNLSYLPGTKMYLLCSVSNQHGLGHPNVYTYVYEKKILFLIHKWI